MASTPHVLTMPTHHPTHAALAHTRLLRPHVPTTPTIVPYCAAQAHTTQAQAAVPASVGPTHRPRLPTPTTCDHTTPIAPTIASYPAAPAQATQTTRARAQPTWTPPVLTPPTPTTYTPSGPSPRSNTPQRLMPAQSGRGAEVCPPVQPPHKGTAIPSFCSCLAIEVTTHKN